ncbi:hypothetical protein CDL15_Pgr027387 [Punica granatum]|uniref:Uncharacterized protein n=1 Tax=Punica granatum TaxID=22663 RepID=A0A218Y1D8_PUNGR|nr:hypothetical protein CDL15_Pgr027387 [Punica granatum]PKI40854.1 hypothetical protein CRG98_038761 [Punica granatum]
MIPGLVDTYSLKSHQSCSSFHDILVPMHNNSLRIKINPKRNKEVDTANSSPPVVIPEISVLRSPKHPDDYSLEEEDWLGDKKMVPPHVMVERRVDGKMISSACARNGRMPKGRYMSEVRNSILRIVMTH